jgi:hypothetical protein
MTGNGLPMTCYGLHAAATVLDALAAGETPERATFQAGAQALDRLCRAMPKRDFLDAAAALNALEAGIVLLARLDDAGRKRVGDLAKVIRREALASNLHLVSVGS